MATVETKTVHIIYSTDTAVGFIKPDVSWLFNPPASVIKNGWEITCTKGKFEGEKHLQIGDFSG